MPLHFTVKTSKLTLWGLVKKIRIQMYIDDMHSQAGTSEQQMKYCYIKFFFDIRSTKRLKSLNVFGIR